jgi:hypothetical protein
MKRKGQMTLEIVVMLLLVINLFLYVSMPAGDVAMAATESVGSAAFAMKAVNDISQKAQMVGIGGDGARDWLEITMRESFGVFSCSGKELSLDVSIHDFTTFDNAFTEFGLRPVIQDPLDVKTYSNTIDFGMDCADLINLLSGDYRACVCLENQNNQIILSAHQKTSSGCDCDLPPPSPPVIYLTQCGGAARDYSDGEVFPVDELCRYGTNYSNPSLGLDNGDTASWNCINGTASDACMARRVLDPVDAACGTANRTYDYDADFPGTFTYCDEGQDPSPSPAPPPQGGLTAWTCTGLNGGDPIDCIAEREAAPAAACDCDSCASCNQKLSDDSCSIVELTQDISAPSGSCITGIIDPSNPGSHIPLEYKTFDCQLNKITANPAYWGVVFKDPVNMTIQNCRIVNSNVGIQLYGEPVGNIIKGNAIITPGHQGISIFGGGTSNTITENYVNISSNLKTGIYVSSPNTTIKYNILESSGGLFSDKGIRVDPGGDYCVLLENTACSHQGDIELISVIGCSGSGNTCDNAIGHTDSDALPGQPCRYTCP